MDMNRIFDQFERLQQTASWRAVFGEPVSEGDTTIIPLARVTYGFGGGFGSGQGEPDEEGHVSGGEGGGYGGGVNATPAGVVVIQGDHVEIKPNVNASLLGVAGILMAAWNVFWIANTIRRVRELSAAD